MPLYSPYEHDPEFPAHSPGKATASPPEADSRETGGHDRVGVDPTQSNVTPSRDKGFEAKRGCVEGPSAGV